MSLDKTCPVYIKERKIRNIMSEFNVSYRKALDMYIPPLTSIETSDNRHTLTPSYETVKATQTPTSPSIPMSPVLQTNVTFAQKTARKETVSSQRDTTNKQQNANERTSQPQTDKEEESRKTSKKKKHKKKAPQFEASHTQDCCMDFQEDTCSGDATEEEDDGKNEDSEDDNSFGWLMHKIKYILFVSNDTFKVKIITIVQISIEWAISGFLNKIIPKDFASFKKYFRNEDC